MNDNTYQRDRRKTRGDFASREQTTHTVSNMIIHAMKTANNVYINTRQSGGTLRVTRPICVNVSDVCYKSLHMEED